MCLEPFPEQDPCVIRGVQPFLNELQHPVRMQLHTRHDSGRAAVEQFVRTVFWRRYGARLHSPYPTLLAFSGARELQAAVGFRCAGGGPLFAEHYLPAPVEALVSARWSMEVTRTRLVEVGNLALAGPGDARWVIAAVTSFLYACGYRWVLFTAVRPLFNAFQRLGLRPVALAVADPARLPDGGRDWGSYYDHQPLVCVGDIQSGHRKLRNFVAASQPMLGALLDEAARQAAPDRSDAATRLEGAR